jgi:RNA polymerase sigma-70 factor (ECF subfamily)
MDTASAGAATGALATAFDREWALAILEQSLERARAEQSGDDASRTFEVLKDFIPGGAQARSYEEAAAQLGISVAALKSEIHRLRRRFRAYVRDEVAQTVSAPHEIELEMAHLQQVLSDRGTEMSRRPKLERRDS